MAKRFIDTDIWRKQWFRELKPKLKLFWFYIIGNCDNAGIWEADLKLAEFQMGVKLDLKELNEAFKDKIIVVGNGKWFIKKFPEFQYGKGLSERNPAHRSVIDKLKKYDLEHGEQLTLEGASKGLQRGFKAPKDKDKDKDIITIIDNILSKYNISELKDSYMEWVKFRKEIKKKITPSIAEKQIKLLARWGVEKARASIEQSIRNGWQGLFEPEREAKKQKLTDVIKET